MGRIHPLLCEFPELTAQLLEQQAKDPLMAHLLADYETLLVRLTAYGEHSSLEYQALEEELQTLKLGLLQYLSLPDTEAALSHSA